MCWRAGAGPRAHALYVQPAEPLRRPERLLASLRLRLDLRARAIDEGGGARVHAASRRRRPPSPR
eukprot:469510-Prymnesium_polylepis.1